jgi:hypothetical protein
VNGYIQTELSKNDPNVAYTIELWTSQVCRSRCSPRIWDC